MDPKRKKTISSLRRTPPSKRTTVIPAYGWHTAGMLVRQWIGIEQGQAKRRDCGWANTESAAIVVGLQMKPEVVTEASSTTDLISQLYTKLADSRVQNSYVY